MSLGMMQCLCCLHWRGGKQCSAFIDGIPEQIWQNLFDHRNAFPDDQGIQFLAKDAWHRDMQASLFQKSHTEDSQSFDEEEEESKVDEIQKVMPLTAEIVAVKRESSRLVFSVTLRNNSDHAISFKRYPVGFEGMHADVYVPRFRLLSPIRDLSEIETEPVTLESGETFHFILNAEYQRGILAIPPKEYLITQQEYHYFLFIFHSTEGSIITNLYVFVPAEVANLPAPPPIF